MHNLSYQQLSSKIGIFSKWNYLSIATVKYSPARYREPRLDCALKISLQITFILRQVQSNLSSFCDTNHVKLIWYLILKLIWYKHLVAKALTQSAITCSKLTIETLERGVKYVQS